MGNHVAEPPVDRQHSDRPAGPLAVGQETRQELDAERLNPRLGVEHPSDIAARPATPRVEQ